MVSLAGAIFVSGAWLVLLVQFVVGAVLNTLKIAKSDGCRFYDSCMCETFMHFVSIYVFCIYVIPQAHALGS